MPQLARGTDPERQQPGRYPLPPATKFELIINLKTAKALGVKIPQSLLARADELI
jgi:putative tryptophan/tyrosine transport system substrate-binding protein